MAREVGLSHRQLNRRFREATGLSQQQYLMRVRIEEACVRLRGSDDALCDIAFGLGFSDQSAFTAQFRKRMGLTPRQYRIEFA
ncbi:MAG: helix-turn-helix transcriptional regulator [Akkermansiaceae bacterium]